MNNEAALLSRWFKKAARKLPWRETRDPYAIWISEVMLQQTQVATVIPYYLRFLEKFPNLEALANSPEETVLTLWSGLGYYSRAKNLRKGAQYLVSRNSAFPREREEILQVPGIGPYTAGAILSISFDLPVPLVDGNVQRVYSRYFGFKEFIQSKVAHDFFWKQATLWVQAAESPRILNQALMELGALICTKANPDCERCPLRTSCIAYKKGLQKLLPRKKPRRETIHLHWKGLILKKQERFFLRKSSPGEWWAGLWDFPHLEESERAQSKKSYSSESKKTLYKDFGQPRKIIELDHCRHTVTHHRIHIAPFLLELTSRDSQQWDGRWFTIEELQNLPLSALAKKMLASLPL